MLQKKGIENESSEEEINDEAEQQESDSGSDVSMTDSSEDEEITENFEDTMSDEENETVEEQNVEEEEEDEVIKAIKRENQRQRDHPPIIQCEDFIADICFHPKNDLLAVASIVGDVMFYKYTNEANELINTLELHAKACRDVEFSEDGELLFSTGKDKSVMVTNVESGKLISFFDNAHSEAINRIAVIDENLLATGKRI